MFIRHIFGRPQITVQFRQTGAEELRFARLPFIQSYVSLRHLMQIEESQDRASQLIGYRAGEK